MMTTANNIITNGAKAALTRNQFLELEIAKWKKSKARKDMITGSKYYVGRHDILQRKRTMIGKDGLLQEVENLPNNRIVDNQYAKMVDQKKNYLLGKPLTFDTENDIYEKALKEVFNRKFQRTLKNLGEDSLNCGIAWLHPYIDDKGVLCFKKFEGFEVLAFWKDAEHTILDYAVRVYEVEGYDGAIEKIYEKVEIYTIDGIERFNLENGKLVPDVETPSSDYLTVDGEGLNWEHIPLIAFKYNNKELPLISRIKSLQDGINTIVSDFQNNMQEDARNTIIVLKNYDGQNLGEFRHNLAAYGVVKVKTMDRGDGGVETLNIEVNAENYKAILDVFKKALIENARGYDAKDERMNNSPNQMNIRSMFSDIDLDANDMETEYQAAFEELLWFVNSYLDSTGKGDFTKEECKVIFDRDIMVNESETITNCTASVGVLSNETIVANHPWVTDVSQEMDRLKTEKQEAVEEYQGAFGSTAPAATDDTQAQGGEVNAGSI